MKDWNTIGTAIQTKLNGYVGAGQPLVGAFDAHDTKFEGYPVATWEWEDGESDTFTTAENKRVYIASIYIHHEFESGTRSTANRIIAQTLSTIQQAFEADHTLGGACDFTLPGPAKWGVYQEGAGMIRYGSIRVKFVASAIV